MNMHDCPNCGPLQKYNTSPDQEVPLLSCPEHGAESLAVFFGVSK